MPKYTQPRKTWMYSTDFKVKAVQLSQQNGIQVKQVAEGLDIHPFMLSRWRKEFREGKLVADRKRRVSVTKNKKVPSKAELVVPSFLNTPRLDGDCSTTLLRVKRINMAHIIKERMTAETDTEFVVFLLGMRINKLWKIHKWLPLTTAMPKMIAELNDNPDMGFISHEQWFGRTTIMVQYWKSFEHLEAYAKNRDSNHLPVWSQFNKDIGSNGDVGIWHETYLIKPGRFESIYHNMPTFGLAKAMNSVPAIGKYKSASDRLHHQNR